MSSYQEQRSIILDKLVSPKKPHYNIYVHSIGLDLIKLIDLMDERISALEKGGDQNK